jgi:Fe-S-cluster-containing dehydrogenase component
VTTWPDSVWDAAALRGVDERGRAEIEAAGRVEDFEKGAKTFSIGEPADDFFVVVEGEIEIRAVPRGEEKTRVLRRVVGGDAFGEESILRAGASRQMDAIVAKAARVARVPVGIFSRVAERSGGNALLSSKRRSLGRAATLDLLRTMALTRDLAEKDLEAFLDASEMRTIARGKTLFRAEDPATHLYFVVDGMFQLQSEHDGRAHVRAYLARGDEVGDVELANGSHHVMSAIASGASTIIAIRADAVREVAARHPNFFERGRRTLEENQARQQHVALNAMTTQHVMKDLYRLEVARSLLVIDQDSCVRCGHCAWSCATSHDDGVARLIRRGDKVVSGEAEAASSLLLPNSCQHCENPACMIDCPTGAIGRDPRGDVFIREEICIGCGNCAKGCPWDNIQMAPKSPGKKGISASVAVKCDVCNGREEGPACVAACPVQAIARVSPIDSIRELGAIRGVAQKNEMRVVPRPPPAWPWVLGALAFAVAAVLLGASAIVTGLLSGLTCAALSTYPIFKRVARARAVGQSKVVDPERASHSRVRIHYVAHVALGTFAIGVVAAHVASHTWSSLGTSLTLAFIASSCLGITTAVAYKIIPRVLTRLDRKGALPEDVADRIREARERTFTDLTGRSDLVKTIYRRVLDPYANSATSTIMLVLSGKSLRQEERALRSRVDEMLGGRGSEKLEGLEALIGDVVERRALVAERMLNAILRGGFGVHVVASALVVVLVLIHAYVEIVYAK